jgi:type IV pilus assembly protein PilV
MKTTTHSLPRSAQAGFTLIESLVALVVAALGIMGIVGIQMRTLAGTQTSSQRSQAIQLIQNLSERLQNNPNASANAADYVIGWNTATDNSIAKLKPLTPRAGTLCDTGTCSASDQAKFDIREWKRSVELALGPGVADANVFTAVDETTATDRRQLGVMISWRQNESATDTAAVFNITSTSTGAAGCPTDRICQLQYIQLASRCKVDDRAGPSSLLTFCPE